MIAVYQVKISHINWSALKDAKLENIQRVQTSAKVAAHYSAAVWRHLVIKHENYCASTVLVMFYFVMLKKLK